jgi:hypothetical protein
MKYQIFECAYTTYELENYLNDLDLKGYSVVSVVLVKVDANTDYRNLYQVITMNRNF